MLVAQQLFFAIAGGLYPFGLTDIRGESIGEFFFPSISERLASVNEQQTMLSHPQKQKKQYFAPDSSNRLKFGSVKVSTHDWL